jgi:hypothetical protein
MMVRTAKLGFHSHPTDITMKTRSGAADKKAVADLKNVRCGHLLFTQKWVIVHR